MSISGENTFCLLRLLTFVVIVFQANRSPIPYTPLCLSKAVKNATEIQGMKTAHVRTTSVRSPHGTDTVCLLCALLFLSPNRSKMQLLCVNSLLGWKRRYLNFNSHFRK